MSENGKGSGDLKRSAWTAITDRLKTNTILAKLQKTPFVPDNVLSFLRTMADPSDDDPDLQDITNPYQHAKKRLNKIWGGRESYQSQIKDESPVAKLTTFRGAVTSYFTGEKWKRGAVQLGTVGALATLSAANVAWIAEAYAGVANAAAQMSNPENSDVSSELTNALGKLAMLGGIQVGSAWSMIKVNGVLAKDIAQSIKRSFKDAAFEFPDMLYRISHNKKNKDAPDFMPDNPHQRMNQAADEFANGLVRLGTDAYVATLTAAFVGMALYQNSVPIEALNGFGEHLNTMFPNAEVDFKQKGTFVAAVGVIAAYLGFTIPKGVSLSNKIKDTYKEFQNRSSNVTKRLVDAFDNAEAIAASKGHKSADDALEEDITKLDQAWRDENDNFARYIMFMQGQSFIGHNLIAFVPSYLSTFGKEGIVSAANPVQAFFETQSLVSALLGSMSQVVYLLPEYARTKGQLERITEMARRFNEARDKKAFYGQSGICEFEEKDLGEEGSDIAIRVQNLELMFAGQSESFLKAPALTVNKGDWVHVRAESGAGKSCLMRALAGGIWPHGRGTIEKHESDHIFYAFQTPDLSGSESLMEHLIYGMPDANTHEITPMRKEKMKQALQEAGLGQLVGEMGNSGLSGKSWEEIMSGGQKQRLVLARILYQEPDIILLDEATSALDPAAKRDFFEKLDMYSGNATVLAITHDENTPKDELGDEYFNKRLEISGGIAALTNIEMERKSPANDDEAAPRQELSAE